MESTRRLYHEDPEQRMFRARVVASRPGSDGISDVILDATAFYPTGGGQPHDTGRLSGLPVVDVLEEGDAVVHRVRGAPPSGEVEGEIDWVRRQDHRQQHSGQHALSRAFVEVAEARTVGFHLGSETCTIDLDREVGRDSLARAERRANDVILSGADIRVTWYDRAEDLPSGLRKDAPEGGRIRIVSIGTFDATPCCGTHCARAGDIGAIKILGAERSRGGTRVEFVSGRRTLADHERRLSTLQKAALLLTTETSKVPERIEALLDDLKALRGALERSEDTIRQAMLERWGTPQARRLAVDLGEGRASWLVPFAGKLAARRGGPVLLGSLEKGEGRVALALPDGAPGHAGNEVRALLAACGGRGGGSERVGQGRLPAEALQRFLETWERGHA